VSSRQHLTTIANAMGATEIEITSYFTPNNHFTGGGRRDQTGSAARLTTGS